MKEAKSRTESKKSGGTTSEFGAVTIDFNPAPDAEDRLRRLFTLLLKYAAREGQAASTPNGSAKVEANDRTEDGSSADQSS